MTERALSSRDVYFARPFVKIDGRADGKVAELLLALRMTESEGGLSSLEMRLDNLASDVEGGASYAFEDEQVVKLGARVEVYGGEEAAPREIFRGVITGLEGTFSEESGPELLVLAEDKLQRARMVRRTKVHEDAKLADLARDVANALSLRPVITGLTESIGTHVQNNESDLSFLRRLLHAYDADLQVVGDELHVSPRADVDRGEVTLALSSQLRSARFIVDLAHQATEVTASGWDVAQSQRVSATGVGAHLGPGSGRRGSDVLRDKLGDRSEHVAVAAVKQAEAQAVADSAFDRRARRFVVVEGTAAGNPALRVGTRVRIEGTSRRFENTYYVVRACHRFDKVRGYLTDFEAECAYLGNV